MPSVKVIYNDIHTRIYQDIRIVDSENRDQAFSDLNNYIRSGGPGILEYIRGLLRFP